MSGSESTKSLRFEMPPRNPPVALARDVPLCKGELSAQKLPSRGSFGLKKGVGGIAKGAEATHATLRATNLAQTRGTL